MASDEQEQLRRLKNTVMGASHRLSLLARGDAIPHESSPELLEVSQLLAQCARRLERLLAGLRSAG
jgi:hypothetical protein